MHWYARLLLFLFLSALAVVPTAARGDNLRTVQSDSAVNILDDSVEIHFRQSKWNLDRSLAQNDSALRRIHARLTTVTGDSVYVLRGVSVTGGASPEGPLAFNQFLSEQRAATLFAEMERYRPLTEAEKRFTFLGRDREGVLRMAQKDPHVPFRTETIALLNEIARQKRLSGHEPSGSLERLKTLRDGKPYRYLYRTIFPNVRASRLVIDYERVPATGSVATRTDTVYIPVVRRDTVVVRDTVVIYDCPPCRPFYMDIRSNMLYDALLLPNIGVEFYLGSGFSAGANWLYGWWSRDANHRYWRAYGGELFGRWWLGRAARRKPLTGHHIGLYAQIYTYDFEFGGEGEMGGKPEGTLWDRHLWGVGAEYGYSLPVARRWNIDFSIGAGYTAGRYHRYYPENGDYMWKATYNRRLWIVTKAEIALVWLIGCDNYNRWKGGGR